MYRLTAVTFLAPDQALETTNCSVVMYYCASLYVVATGHWRAAAGGGAVLIRFPRCQNWQFVGGLHREKRGTLSTAASQHMREAAVMRIFLCQVNKKV